MVFFISAEINKNDQILIHFDGWTKRYDYWTEPGDPALHPIGYIEYLVKSGKSPGARLSPPGSKSLYSCYVSFLII